MKNIICLDTSMRQKPDKIAPIGSPWKRLFILTEIRLKNIVPLLSHTPNTLNKLTTESISPREALKTRKRFLES